MPAFLKFEDFLRQVLNKEHDLDSDAITIALTNTAPDNGDAYLSDITEIDYTGVSGSRLLQSKSLTQSGGIARLDANDILLTGAGSGFGPFRYVVLFNDTPGTAATKGLIGYFDNGSALTVAAGETLSITFDHKNFILTFSP